MSFKETLSNGSFAHKDIITYNNVDYYINPITVNNFKSLSKALITSDDETKMELLKDFIEYLNPELPSKVKLYDVYFFLLTSLMNSSLESLDYECGCSHCGAVLKFSVEWDILNKVYSRDDMEFRHETDINGNKIEFVISEPLLERYDWDSEYSFIKDIYINDDKVDIKSKDDLNSVLTLMDSKEVIQILSNASFGTSQSLNTDKVIRCYDCAEINNVRFDDKFIQKVCDDFTQQEFNKLMDEEVFIAVESSNYVGSMGDFSLLDFNLYVNKLKETLIKKEQRN